ncbi:hypothetical protein HOO65_010213 [Ceratocystis lukuohia]|uniref:C2H2-type domain-containing protein n=1 Tax=Ceratocystis lukuohia TaxID=2019550 RepID=A0ABR4MRH6_9PEZI
MAPESTGDTAHLATETTPKQNTRTHHDHDTRQAQRTAASATLEKSPAAFSTEPGLEGSAGGSTGRAVPPSSTSSLPPTLSSAARTASSIPDKPRRRSTRTPRPATEIASSISPRQTVTRKSAQRQQQQLLREQTQQVEQQQHQQEGQGQGQMQKQGQERRARQHPTAQSSSSHTPASASASGASRTPLRSTAAQKRKRAASLSDNGSENDSDSSEHIKRETPKADRQPRQSKKARTSSYTATAGVIAAVISDYQHSNNSHKRANFKSDGHGLACPFYCYDPVGSRECRNFLLTKISYVKQHLTRHHRRPLYCTRCLAEFDEEDGLQVHVRAKVCEEKETVHRPRGVTEEQLRQLRGRVDQKKRVSDQWFDIYSIVFPNAERPKSVIVDHDVSPDVGDFIGYLLFKFNEHIPRLAAVAAAQASGNSEVDFHDFCPGVRQELSHVTVDVAQLTQLIKDKSRETYMEWCRMTKVKCDNTRRDQAERQRTREHNGLRSKVISAAANAAASVGEEYEPDWDMDLDIDSELDHDSVIGDYNYTDPDHWPITAYEDGELTPLEMDLHRQGLRHDEDQQPQWQMQRRNHASADQSSTQSGPRIQFPGPTPWPGKTRAQGTEAPAHLRSHSRSHSCPEDLASDQAGRTLPAQSIWAADQQRQPQDRQALLQSHRQHQASAGFFEASLSDSRPQPHVPVAQTIDAYLPYSPTSLLANPPMTYSHDYPSGSPKHTSPFQANQAPSAFVSTASALPSSEVRPAIGSYSSPPRAVLKRATTGGVRSADRAGAVSPSTAGRFSPRPGLLRSVTTTGSLSPASSSRMLPPRPTSSGMTGAARQMAAVEPPRLASSPVNPPGSPTMAHGSVCQARPDSSGSQTATKERRGSGSRNPRNDMAIESLLGPTISESSRDISGG